MSVKGDIFRQLATYLMDTLQFDQVATLDNPYPLPNLKWVDKQMGQFNHPELSQLVPLPAILIGFRKTSWMSNGRGTQNGESILTFWVYYENYADSFNGSMNQAIALNFFEFNEAVHQALQGLHSDNFTALDRISDEDDEDHDMIIGTIFEYTTVIADNSGDAQLKSTIVTDKDAFGKYIRPLEPEPKDSGEDDSDNQFRIS